MTWFGWILLAPFLLTAFIVLIVGVRPSAADPIICVLKAMPALVRELMAKHSGPAA